MAERSGAKVRSPSQEKALDEKIAQIQQKNKQVEERYKVRQDEAKQVHQIKTKNEQTPESVPNEAKKDNRRPPKNNGGDREWDTGKTPASQWKVNVPEFGDGAATSRRRRFHPNQRYRHPNPRPGFQHDDRFLDDKNGENAENGGAIPNSRPPRRHNNRRGPPRQPREQNGEQQDGVEQENRRPPQHRRHKKDIFERVTKTDENGENVPFRGQRQHHPPRPGGPRRAFNPRHNAPRTFTKRRSAASESGENVEKPEGEKPSRRPNNRGPRRPRPQNGEQPPAEGGDGQVEKKKKYKPQPNRPVPDKVQVRQVVRAMVGKVCANERREQKALPNPKETEL
ncbi:unnamed protein product [Bursaphelenchus okinawaensis]|uniref:Uncharacterized protein n=1 Tax=Bursaphelenchus okinawaensis TaxID=465554 RepID=A0A811L8A6_9BILA|nr:unnamed protein product [Bursaphelenchus okinawaensis]CAG9120988.1 unnamed protein product [Bursaphelenchus okinawaensis]